MTGREAPAMLPVLATPRLMLRPATGGDVEALWQMLILPEVRRYLCDDNILPRATVAGLVDEASGLHGRGLGLWVAEQAGAVAGLVALKPVADVLTALIPALAGEVEPTVALLPRHWGQGLAGEALAGVLAHGFATLGLARIAAICDVPNTASRRMLERAGFRRTGEHPGLKYRLHAWMLEAAS